jgi:hypothetical protein
VTYVELFAHDQPVEGYLMTDTTALVGVLANGPGESICSPSALVFYVDTDTNEFYTLDITRITADGAREHIRNVDEGRYILVVEPGQVSVTRETPLADLVPAVTLVLTPYGARRIDPMRDHQPDADTEIAAGTTGALAARWTRIETLAEMVGVEQLTGRLGRHS